jgi:hypothetical protein
MIVASHFHLRLEVFFQVVLFPKFNIVDHWHRYEWQARGSSHSHGLYWIDGIPDPGKLTDIMGNLNEEVRDHLAPFCAYTLLASTLNRTRLLARTRRRP